MKHFGIMTMALALVSATSFAGDHTINAAARASWKSQDNDVKKTTIPSSSSFGIDYLRTTFAGTLTPSVKYFLTTDLLGDKTADAVDGLSSFIDEAYVTKNFTATTSLVFGKKAVLIGGREYDYLNFDRYTVSSFFAATPANQAGVTINHEIAGQTFTAQYFNGNKKNGYTANSQSKFGYSVGWTGNIGEGMIRPIFAYSVVPKAKSEDLADAASATGVSGSTRDNKGDDAYLAAGVQFNLSSGIIFEADYDLLTQKEAKSSGIVKNDIKTNSLVALLKYNTDTYSPFVKLVSETRKTDSTKNSERTAYDLGIEFKEAKDDSIRYHIVYSGSTLKADMNTTEVKSSPSSILVGLKFDASILK